MISTTSCMGELENGGWTHLFKPPEEAEAEEEDGRCGFAHGVEAQGDERQAVVGEADVEPRRQTIGNHCTGHKLGHQQGSSCSCTTLLLLHAQFHSCCDLRKAQTLY